MIIADNDMMKMMFLSTWLSSFNTLLLRNPNKLILQSSGRDDAKIAIPGTVVLRHMFSPAEMRADENLCAEVEEDVKEESMKHGPFDSVKVCELHPQGVVLIRFKDRKDAQKCIDAMNGRWYAKRQIHASLDDGSVNHAAVRDFDAEAERFRELGFPRGLCLGAVELGIGELYVFQDKDLLGSDDEAVQGNDHNAYPDAATPEIKDEMVDVSDAMPRDFNQEQVEDLVAGDEFMEDAQAPQTPGLVEVPNLSSVRDQLACDDHMEVEDPNAEEVRKASGEPDANEPSEYPAGESAVAPMDVDKSLINETIDAQNEPQEERTEHVHVTSPCVSHITNEMENPGQVITESGTNVITDKSDAVPSVESPGEPTMSNAEHCLTQEPKDPGEENQDHFAITTEVNQETDSSLQVDEQLNNAQATDEGLGDLTGSADTDLPAPEKVLAAPNGLGDENGCMVELESTPDKEDTGTCNGDAGNNNITGKKRTFTESTLTAESLNSVESVGLIQSKRTANSVPDDDDLLSSILVGKSSFLKMRSTPVLEVATTKRLKSAPRSTTTKRKVLMDDPMEMDTMEVAHDTYLMLQEMDTMEVAHDTGFLNVDDDEVDEDHEDDGMEEGDEARLLENSGWSSRTRAVAKYLQTIFDKEAENGKNVIVADKLLAGKTRKEASRMFFETLVLKTRDYVQVEQAKPYESIIIKPRPKLTKSIF
ncbi:hypothetical protein F2Q69_00044749 [Brassica cretica]|uniref:RRM domain-containing protein n=1 Tax=Brassica cretica TaxID=69181 RepID=A0A8S9NC46_BRACR|nr:hypothetical protein F2Q69_00044749 [Brassica cretica]